MFWTKKGPKKQSPDKIDALAARVSVEVGEHGRSKQRAVSEVRQAALDLNRTITRNGFTIRIHQAAGGKH